MRLLFLLHQTVLNDGLLFTGKQPNLFICQRTKEWMNEIRVIILVELLNADYPFLFWR